MSLSHDRAGDFHGAFEFRKMTQLPLGYIFKAFFFSWAWYWFFSLSSFW